MIELIAVAVMAAAIAANLVLLVLSGPWASPFSTRLASRLKRKTAASKTPPSGIPLEA